MRPALNSPLWDRIGPESRAQLQRQVLRDDSLIDRALVARAGPDVVPGLVLAYPDAVLDATFAGLRRSAAIDTVIAYAPAAMALATAIWTLGAFEPGRYTSAAAGLFLIFALFGLISVRLQGKHRLGLNNPQDLEHVARLVRYRCLVTPDGIAEYGTLPDPRSAQVIALARIAGVTRISGRLRIDQVGTGESLHLPACVGLRDGSALSETETDADLARILGTRFIQPHATPHALTHGGFAPWSLTTCLSRLRLLLGAGLPLPGSRSAPPA